MADTEHPHLLLLPGLLNDRRLWRRQLTDLAHLADVSVADLTVSDSISGMAAAVLAAVPARQFAMAGLSLGGYVALEIMRQAPDRVRALALLDTSARPDTSAGRQGRRALMDLAATDFPAVIETLLPKMLHFSQLHYEVVDEEFRAMATDLGQSVFLRQQKAIMERPDSRPHLDRIACPTLVLCGRQDVITPIAVHQELVAAIPHASFTVLDQCGHLSPLGQPHQVTAALKAWLLHVPATAPLKMVCDAPGGDKEGPTWPAY